MDLQGKPSDVETLHRRSPNKQLPERPNPQSHKHKAPCTYRDMVLIGLKKYLYRNPF